jgi:hypothetical protein
VGFDWGSDLWLAMVNNVITNASGMHASGYVADEQMKIDHC